ncbi:MAG: CvpA family protein [Clostridia bacterium]|nr:CvpA family protein [Clostridia bacterium]
MEEYIVDIILAVVFAAVTAIYFFKGIVKTVLGFASFLIAGFLARHLNGAATDWIISNTNLLSGMEHKTAGLTVLAVSFIVFWIVLRLIILLIDKLFKLPVLKQANKILGGVFGALCGAMVVMLLCVCLRASSHIVYSPRYKNAIDNSRVVQFVISNEDIADKIKLPVTGG